MTPTERTPSDNRPTASDSPAPQPPRCYRPLGAAKIQPHHLERLALVYIRQSTAQQVLEHRESTRRQYGLVDYAVALGWPAERVLVIDEDQGQSGRTAAGRSGFQYLLAEVTLDHAGLVLGLEMSRLARSCKDCQHLIEVCGIFRTLLADQDGIYDANDPNDRLLLGLKGTISEVELHTMRSRLERGRLNKAQRGELFHSVPRGYLRLPGGPVEFDPDAQVQAVIRLIFDKFDELGTIRAVCHYLQRHDIRLGGRILWGPQRGQLYWQRPTPSAVAAILHHPLYAGTYSHGRTATDPKRQRPGQPGSGRVVVPRAEWKVCLPGCLPAYISWERYLANQQRLQHNQSRSGTPGTPRSGGCLLSGLLVCGPCGWRMQACYARAALPTYACHRHANQGTGSACPGFRAAVIDELVAEQVLRALEPAALQLSLQAVADVAQERQRLDQHWQQQLQRARYETQAEERRYQLVDPANRLVANALEQRWEQALRRQRQLEEEYDRFVRQQPAPLTTSERQRLTALAQDIPALWRAATTTMPQRKEIVRCLVEKVVATVAQRSESVAVTIHWAGGFVSQHQAVRPVRGYEQLRHYATLQERLVALYEAGHTAAAIAVQLNAEGWRPPKQRATFNRQTVQQWLWRHGLSPQRSAAARLRRGEWRQKDLAAALGMEAATLRLWRRRGWLQGRRVGAANCWLVWADASELRRLRQLLEFSQQHPRAEYPQRLLVPKQRRRK
jgi:DNA invertase Pin-like site-specific DNA recombinase